MFAWLDQAPSGITTSVFGYMTAGVVASTVAANIVANANANNNNNNNNENNDNNNSNNQVKIFLKSVKYAQKTRTKDRK